MNCNYCTSLLAPVQGHWDRPKSSSHSNSHSPFHQRWRHGSSKSFPITEKVYVTERMERASFHNSLHGAKTVSTTSRPALANLALRHCTIKLRSFLQALTASGTSPIDLYSHQPAAGDQEFRKKRGGWLTATISPHAGWFLLFPFTNCVIMFRLSVSQAVKQSCSL